MPQVSQVYKPIERIELILLWVILLLITYQLISYYFNKHGQSFGISKSKFFDMVQCKCKKRLQSIVKIIEFHQSINRVHSEKTLEASFFKKFHNFYNLNFLWKHLSIELFQVKIASCGSYWVIEMHWIFRNSITVFFTENRSLHWYFWKIINSVLQK